MLETAPCSAAQAPLLLFLLCPLHHLDQIDEVVHLLCGSCCHGCCVTGCLSSITGLQTVLTSKGLGRVSLCLSCVHLVCSTLKPTGSLCAVQGQHPLSPGGGSLPGPQRGSQHCCRQQWAALCLQHLQKCAPGALPSNASMCLQCCACSWRVVGVKGHHLHCPLRCSSSPGNSCCCLYQAMPGHNQQGL